MLSNRGNKGRAIVCGRKKKTAWHRVIHAIYSIKWESVTEILKWVKGEENGIPFGCMLTPCDDMLSFWDRVSICCWCDGDNSSTMDCFWNLSTVLVSLLFLLFFSFIYSIKFFSTVLFGYLHSLTIYRKRQHLWLRKMETHK